MKLNEQADWYETHEKSLSKAVRAVVESKAAKRLDDAKTNLTAKLDEASRLLADSDGKVADNATRDALSNAIDAANGLKDGNDPAKIDGARKTLEDAINGVNASVQAKTDADAQAAAAAAAAAQAQAQDQSTYNGGSSYSGGAYRRTEGSTSGSNTYRGTKLAEAKEACVTAADGVRSQANEYNALLNGDAADAAAVKAEQVKDSKTVESWARSSRPRHPNTRAAWPKTRKDWMPPP